MIRKRWISELAVLTAFSLLLTPLLSLPPAAAADAPSAAAVPPATAQSAADTGAADTNAEVSPAADTGAADSGAAVSPASDSAADPAAGAIGAVAGEAGETAGLLRNGSFEELDGELPLGWNRYLFSGAPVVETDGQNVKDGDRALKISAETSARLTIYQDIVIPKEQKNRIYLFSQWIRTDRYSGAGIYNRMFLINGSGTRQGPLIELKKLQGTAEWTLVQGSIFVPGDDQIAGIKIENFFDTGTGTAWFDGAALVPLEPGADGELVINGGFEATDSNGSILNWSTWIASGKPTVTADTYRVYAGQASLKIAAPETGRAAVFQTVPLKPEQLGQTFKIGLWIRTEAVTGGAVARLQYNNSGGQRVGALEYLDTVRETADWTRVEKTIRVPGDPSIVSVKIENFLETGTGTAWFDEVSLVPWYPLEGLELSAEQYEMNAGDTATFDVRFIPEHASVREVVWTSSNPSVASVQNGDVTALSDGIAVIAVSTPDEALSASCIVIVGNAAGIRVSDDEKETDENEYVSGRIDAQSDYGRELAYRIGIGGRNGLVHVEPDGFWTYFPNEGFTGTDSFIVVVEDGMGSYGLSKTTIRVNAVNHPPVAEDDIQSTDYNTPVSGTLKAQDQDGDPLTFAAETQPAHGTLTLNADGRWTYAPETDYVGADAFTFTATDPEGGTDSAVVRLYTAPSAEHIVREIKTRHPDRRHPRLLAAADDFARIRELIVTDERAAGWFDSVKREADSILPLPPVAYNKPDGLRLDATSSRRAATLAFVYQITQDERYAERAWVELEFISSDAYPDWSPQHYLDTATMTHGVALAYDWLYDTLNEQQRETVRTAIADKGLRPAVPMYLDKTYWWVYNRDNWNFVCNAGMALGALAIADEEEELAGLILREAFKSIQYGLPQYAPDGSAIEGPGYWEYGTIYLVYFLNALETAAGHDYGFSQREGLYETARFPIYIAGPRGTFNYSDNDAGLVPGRLLLWFADRFDQPAYTWYHQFAVNNNGIAGLYDLLWYRPETYGAFAPDQPDQYFDRPKAVTMRSHWNDSHALFVGFKGGVNGAPHGDLDTGSFVFDALGVRWAEDLGKEDYNLPGYWEMGENGKRWEYYRKRAEGHNTLVINPSSGPDQKAEAVSDIVRKQFDLPQGSFAIADMTPAYRNDAASVQRGVALIDHRRQLIVQDEIEMKAPSELYWFMHTRADIQIGESGRTAVLRQGDKRLWVQILTPGEARFTVMPAEPLASSPQPSGQTPNLGVKKLTIHMDDMLRGTISVWMVPLMPGEPLPQQAPLPLPLAQWAVAGGELARLGSIALDGEPLAAFEPDRYGYEVEVPADKAAPPVVTAAAAEDGLLVNVRQAESIPGTARIEVSDPAGMKAAAVYYVSFAHPPEYGLPVDRPVWPVAAIAASGHDGNVPENTIDGNMGTRWSAYGEQWIKYDLGEVRDVSALSLAWYSGNTRFSFFNIEVSVDGEQWERVYDGISSGRTTEHELYPFTPVPARYVRVNGFGNNLNLWNSIAETAVYGPKYEIERAVIGYDREEIKRKDRVPLEAQAYLNSGEPIDMSQVEVRYATTDPKIADVKDGVLVTQKTGTAEIWAEMTYRNKTVRSNVLVVEVVKKNGNGPKPKK